MARTPDLHKRVDLLKRIVDYLEREGLAGFSLGPVAEALGTSKRMLLYYFGSRENLLAQALAAARPDAEAMFGDVHDRAGLQRAGLTLWDAITVGPQRLRIRMLLQLLSLATTQPDRYRKLADDAVQVILRPIKDAYIRLGHSPAEAQSRATLLVSGLRGLCQDRLVTQEGERVDTAARLLIATAAGPPGDT